MSNERLTEELLSELVGSNDIADYLDDNDTSSQTLAGYLNTVLTSRGLKRSDVIHRSKLNETFAYQLFSGERNCSRDKALQLSFGLQLDLHETRHLLMLAGDSDLYCKDRRDAIIIFCIAHGLDLDHTDDELFRFGEKTICG